MSLTRLSRILQLPLLPVLLIVIFYMNWERCWEYRKRPWTDT